MKMIAAFLSAAMFLTFSLNAGTLMFKDGSRLTDVTIVSISEGRVVVEKDKTKKTFSLGQIDAFYKTDMKNVGDTIAPEKDVADYDISFSVKMPEKGVEKEKKETVAASCDITFNIVRKGENKTADKVKWPYFYIYVLTYSGEEYGGRNIYCYYYPNTAKLKSKTYDKAAVMDILGSMARPYYYMGIHNTSMGAAVGKKMKGMTGEREFSVELKDVKNRRILAYYIEVWGNTEIVAQKEWKATGASVGARWWEKYSGNKIIN
ncbi:MAG: hypothetical protein A2017_19440 [Lentisphaerae bacterium GWF2_44_16]|nr:MAG: hypothetical protein A2017_19440 [Lentisphaerae bacterium GWF2_44_16]